MNPVEEYISLQEESNREILNLLHSFILSFEGFHSKLSYGIPFYYRKSWVCYLSVNKKRGIEFAFTRANEFEDITGLLKSNGRKQVKSMMILSKDDIPYEAINELMGIAIKLDDSKKYNVRKSK